MSLVKQNLFCPKFKNRVNSQIDIHQLHVLLNANFIHIIDEKVPLVVRAAFETKEVRRFIQKVFRSKDSSALSFGIHAVAMLGNLIERE